MIALKFLLIAAALFPALQARAETYSECEWLIGPLLETQEKITNRDLASGTAVCFLENGADAIGMAYCGREHMEDATKCANDISIPTLKFHVTGVPGADSGEKPKGSK
ncbi:MAG: hypothetical protein ABL958_06885 [Bdellovibrionia bacterium]